MAAPSTTAEQPRRGSSPSSSSSSSFDGENPVSNGEQAAAVTSTTISNEDGIIASTPQQPYSDPSISLPDTTPSEPHSTITLTIRHQSGSHVYNLPSTSTVSELVIQISAHLSIPAENQKLLISPKPGLLKPPFDTTSPSGSILLAPLANSPKTKITLLGSTPAQIQSLDSALAASQRLVNRRPGSGPVKAASPNPSSGRSFRTISDGINYSFGTIKPLPYLPNPQKSERFLHRLAQDPGIKSTMAKHKWSVGLLTEMDPAMHTTHESRTLGLNRNAGEVIELRLRTDAYDGYRDYKTIRKTLCHELTHNVFGEHDARFWKLCREVEKEVEKADWKSGGRTVGEEEFYNPSDPGVGDEDHDGGAWTGGSFTLGSGGGVAGPSVSSTPAERRQALARAAEERARRARDDARESGSGDNDDGGQR